MFERKEKVPPPLTKELLAKRGDGTVAFVGTRSLERKGGTPF